MTILLRRSRGALSAALLSVSCTLTVARADEPRPAPPRFTAKADGPEDRSAPPQPKGAEYDAYVWARGRSTFTTRFATDNLGTKNDLGELHESRLRMGMAVSPVRWFEGRIEADALSGAFAGDRSSVGLSAGSDVLRYRRDVRFGLGEADLRQAYFALRLPFAELRAGQMSFTWGLGMVANGGEGEPDFGDRRQGDLVQRVALATRLQRDDARGALLDTLVFFLGADRVQRDENADAKLGDRASQGVFGLRATGERLTVGLFQSYRSQTDRPAPAPPLRDRTTVTAGATDLWVEADVLRFGEHRALRVEGEAAFIYGTTTRPYFDDTIDGASIRSFGAVARVRYVDREARLNARLELGYASGDNDTHDATVRSFTFDPDYKVGLILFDQVMPRLQLRSIDRVGDPALLAVAPPGRRFAVGQGSVQNAAYLFPVVRMRPIEALDLRLGYLLALADGDVIDVYQSARQGGNNATYGGAAPGSRMLGQEVLGSVRFTVVPAEPLRLRAGVEGAIFVPGAAFDGVGGARMANVYSGRLLADVAF